MLIDLVKKARTIRRFKERERISADTLRALVDAARQTPSGGNKQPLKYRLVWSEEECATLFPHVRWAGALKEWAGPAEGQRPAAYIIVLCDTEVSKGAGCDHGIAAQTINLCAAEQGIGMCMMGAIDRPAIKQALNIPEQFDVLLTLALGKPAETVVMEPLPADGNIDYYRDARSVHHVPKRGLGEVIVG